MDQNLFMGMLIFALFAILSALGVIIGIFVKPVINLNTNITKLDMSINDLNKTATKMENRLDKQEQDIEDINKNLRTYEGRISSLEASSRS